MKVILASQSPRRRELMDLAKIDYEVIVSEFDEVVDKKFNLEDQSKEIAFGKANDVFNNTQGNRIVIGADSLVILDGEQLGKPKDRDQAIEMLKKITPIKFVNGKMKKDERDLIINSFIKGETKNIVITEAV